jgi:hypothetical protein
MESQAQLFTMLAAVVAEPMAVVKHQVKVAVVLAALAAQKVEQHHQAVVQLEQMQ